MADPDIHERLITRLEETRKALKLVNSAYNGSRIDSLADMAIAYVRRKCPQCNDQGTKQIVGGSTFICSCNRPAYLAECEWRLGGKG